MTASWLLILTYLAALGCGLNAGLFFTFSNFVMKALARVSLESGIAAMQSINVTVINPLFLTLFFGTAVLCLALGIAGPVSRDGAGASLLLVGSLLYLLGTFLVTIVFNVPLNNRLAAVDPTSAAGAELWTHYLARWTLWNHVRTVAALAAATLFTIAR